VSAAISSPVHPHERDDSLHVEFAPRAIGALDVEINSTTDLARWQRATGVVERARDRDGVHADSARGEQLDGHQAHSDPSRRRRAVTDRAKPRSAASLAASPVPHPVAVPARRPITSSPQASRGGRNRVG